MLFLSYMARGYMMWAVYITEAIKLGQQIVVKLVKELASLHGADAWNFMKVIYLSSGCCARNRDNC